MLIIIFYIFQNSLREILDMCNSSIVILLIITVYEIFIIIYVKDMLIMKKDMLIMMVKLKFLLSLRHLLRQFIDLHRLRSFLFPNLLRPACPSACSASALGLLAHLVALLLSRACPVWALDKLLKKQPYAALLVGTYVSIRT